MWDDCKARLSSPEYERSQEAAERYCCVRLFRRCSTVQRRCPSFHSRTPSTDMARSSSSTKGGLEHDLLKGTVVMLTAGSSAARFCCGPTPLQACESSSCSSTQSARTELAQLLSAKSICRISSFRKCFTRNLPQRPAHDFIHLRRFCYWQARKLIAEHVAAPLDRHKDVLDSVLACPVKLCHVPREQLDSREALPALGTPLG